ncbi:GntR family transcriptional regulator [Microbacterium indicum]|uniref:GntR family transcriptional regulator n=1 Tax=Microbacterium indicum TaxID=358100 RepID=UPI0004239E0E|nr:GntR family transcriptional regulator [Microbacterium indicum]
MPPVNGEIIDTHPQRLADAVYDRLAGAIVDGTLSPGQRVRDGDLAETLGVSRMPVREALQRLEHQGLIEMVASRYTRVTDVTPEMPGESLEFLGYQAAVAVHLAVPRMTAAERAEAARLARAVGEHSATDAERAYRSTRELLTFLADHSGNYLFRGMIDDAWLALTRNLQGSTPLLKDVAQVRADFDAVAERIEAGDADGAEQAVRAFYLIGPGQNGPSALMRRIQDERAAAAE